MSTSTAQNPQFTYPSPGSYTVTLQVANAQGSNQIQKVVQVVPPGGFAFVRYAITRGATPGATTTAVTPSALAADHLLVVTVLADGNACTGVTDTLGNPYTPVSADMVASGQHLRSFYSLTAGGGSSPTITATFAGATTSYAWIFVAEYSHVGVFTFVGHAEGAGSTNPATTGGMDLSGRVNLLVVGVNGQFPGTATDPSGWTNRSSADHVLADLLAPTPGAIDYRPSFAGSGTSQVQMMAFTSTLATGAPPTVTITGPTAATTFATESSPQRISGTATDDAGIGSITWTNDRGGAGTATGTTAWVADVPLQVGANVITVTAHDTDGNTSTDVLTITYSAPPLNRRTLYTDDFLRADGSDLGSAWDPFPGVAGTSPFKLVSQRIRPAVASPTVAYESHTGALPADCWASIRVVQATSRADRDNFKIVLRAPAPGGPDTNYTLEVYRASGEIPTMVLSKRVGGVYTAFTSEVTIPQPIWQEGGIVSFEVRRGTGPADPAQLAGYFGPSLRIGAQDSNPITAAGRAGLAAESITDGNLQLTNFASGDFSHTLSMTAGRGDFTLSGKAVSTFKTAAGNTTLTVGPGAFVLSGQAVTLTAPNRVLAAVRGVFTLTGQPVATFKTATTVLSGVSLIRVLSFIPGRRALLVLRATVPSGEQARYVSPDAISIHPNATPEEVAAIRAGQIMERRVSLPPTQILTFAALKTAAQSAQTAFQTEVTNGVTTGMSGFEGSLTKFSGTDWS